MRIKLSHTNPEPELFQFNKHNHKSLSAPEERYPVGVRLKPTNRTQRFSEHLSQWFFWLPFFDPLQPAANWNKLFTRQHKGFWAKFFQPPVLRLTAYTNRDLTRT
jgi:hypothetical protein